MADRITFELSITSDDTRGEAGSLIAYKLREVANIVDRSHTNDAGPLWQGPDNNIGQWAMILSKTD